MKYKRRAQTVEAVQFLYTPKSITDLRKLVSPLVCTVAKDRHPESVATASIKMSENATIQVREGQVIIKDKHGDLGTMSLHNFNNLYEKLEEKQK